MKLLYHLTVLPPQIPQAEALSQEITALRNHFGGELSYLNPNHQSPFYLFYLPRLFFGLHRLKELRLAESSLDLHHLYNPDPFPFPILRWLRRPTIYTISSGVGIKRPNIPFFSKLAAVAVADERSLKQLKRWGLNNSVLVKPGIDTRRFHYVPLPLQAEIRLLVGSAPWTKAQFRSKGVEALLQAAQQAPRLKLIFLWRGVLAAEMKRLVRQMNLTKQVTVLDKLVDVNAILAGVHASIALASRAGIIKSYPHSLLDSLAAGKPILVSQAIPMADYVAETGCGEVVERVTPTDILAAVEALTRNYEAAQKVAYEAGKRDFSQQTMIASYQRVYEQILKTKRETAL